MKNPMEESSSLSTPGLLLGTIMSVGMGGGEENKTDNSTDTLERRSNIGTLERTWGKENQKPSGYEKSDSFLSKSAVNNLESSSILSRMATKSNENSYYSSNKLNINTPSSRTSTLPRNTTTGDRKSLLDDDTWLSLDRRGHTSRDLNEHEVKTTTLTSENTGFKNRAEIEIYQPNSAQDKSRNVSKDRSESPEKEDFGDLTKARSFWKTLDNETVRRQSGDFGSRHESQDFGSRRESKDFGSRRESKDFGNKVEIQDFGSRPANQDIGITQESQDFGNRRQSTDFHSRRQSEDQERRQDGDVFRESKLKVESKTSIKPVPNSISPEPEPDYETDKEKPVPVRRSRKKKTVHKVDKKALKKEEKAQKKEEKARKKEEKLHTQSEKIIEKKSSNTKTEDGKQKTEIRKSSSSIRSHPVFKKRRDSVLSGDLSPPDYSDRAKSPDYDRGRRESSVEGSIDRRSTSRGRRGSSIRRRGSSAGRHTPEYPLVAVDNSTRNLGYESLSRRRSKSTERELTLAKRRETNPDESEHFLSLKLFSQHAEPPLKEFLPIDKQLELENKQREEEDALYRKFLQERREQEDVVINMQEEERDELFDKMNKMERSRIINLANKHCEQMMDLIHREKVQYLTEGGEEMADIHADYPRDPPPIAPSVYKKDDVYENNMNVFEHVDEVAKTAAKENFKTFSNLVRVLVGRCASELDKARAIFRYITEKKFEHYSWFLFYPEEGNTRGAPVNLLRGVEFGIETKALLYKRMCAYAGLHAIVIKGYCKAKDYKPAEEFVDNRWRNAWNAVYVSGGWRFVQPNWAAMHVTTKAARETRQIYQDHYFLTDADKFIFEFFPKKAEHQLLEHPITKEEFEQLPLLRSTFFHFGLGLARSEGLLQATVNCDDRGEANIYLNSHHDISFHYTITNYKNGSTSVKAPGGKYPLGRFVMMSTREEETTFNIHVPQKGDYLLEIGAAKYPTSEECLAQKPIYYINVCKFKIVCHTVDKTIVPLPDCCPGEWGPAKAEKLFGLRGVSHPMPVIYAAPPSNVDLRQDNRSLTLNIEFEKTKPVLDFVTKLYKNGVREEDLKQGARYRIKDQYVIFDIKVPQDGQYGLDIYTREKWEDKMLHICKYLINCDV